MERGSKAQAYVFAFQVVCLGVAFVGFISAVTDISWVAVSVPTAFLVYFFILTGFSRWFDTGLSPTAKQKKLKKEYIEIRCVNCKKKLRGPATASKLRCPAFGSIQRRRKKEDYFDERTGWGGPGDM